MGAGGSGDAGHGPAPRPAKRRPDAAGRGLRLCRRPAEPEHRGHLLPAGLRHPVLRGIRRLLHHGRGSVSGGHGGGRRLRPHRRRPDLLPLLHRRAAVPRPGALRQPAGAHGPVDGHRRRLLRGRRPVRGPVYHPHHPGPHRRSGRYGRGQHGRGHGSRRPRHPVRPVPGHRHHAPGLRPHRHRRSGLSGPRSSGGAVPPGRRDAGGQLHRLRHSAV